jgi:hypothetical protein
VSGYEVDFFDFVDEILGIGADVHVDVVVALVPELIPRRREIG